MPQGTADPGADKAIPLPAAANTCQKERPRLTRTGLRPVCGSPGRPGVRAGHALPGPAGSECRWGRPGFQISRCDFRRVVAPFPGPGGVGKQMTPGRSHTPASREPASCSRPFALGDHPTGGGDGLRDPSQQRCAFRQDPDPCSGGGGPWSRGSAGSGLGS